jgi:hypothetical protein
MVVCFVSEKKGDENKWVEKKGPRRLAVCAVPPHAARREPHSIHGAVVGVRGTQPSRLPPSFAVVDVRRAVVDPVPLSLNPPPSSSRFAQAVPPPRRD